MLKPIKLVCSQRGQLGAVLGDHRRGHHARLGGLKRRRGVPGSHRGLFALHRGGDHPHHIRGGGQAPSKSTTDPSTPSTSAPRSPLEALPLAEPSCAANACQAAAEASSDAEPGPAYIRPELYLGRHLVIPRHQRPTRGPRPSRWCSALQFRRNWQRWLPWSPRTSRGSPIRCLGDLIHPGVRAERCGQQHDWPVRRPGEPPQAWAPRPRRYPPLTSLPSDVRPDAADVQARRQRRHKHAILPNTSPDPVPDPLPAP